jgi:ABC-type dipeptide/oligopeptide/nickel transport system permease component
VTAHLLARLLRLVLVWIGITLATFCLLRLSGDPARLVLGELASADALREFRHLHGLDRPLVEQYLAFVSGVLAGDFGRSLRFEQPILPIILERLPATLELAVASLALSFAVGVSLGVAAALRRDRPVDYLARGLVLVGQGVPNFLLAILMILLFGVALHWLPTGGRGTWAHLVLPSTALSLLLLPLTVRVTRATMLDVVSQDYVRTARSKGLRERTVLGRHALRNAALPILTILGIQTASLLGGSIVTETIFSWPGVGRLIVSAIFARDFPLVQAAVLVVATAVVAVNFIVDSLYGVLDPRISVA